MRLSSVTSNGLGKKTSLVLRLALVCALSWVAALPALAQTPAPAAPAKPGANGQITIPPDLLAGYTIVDARSMVFSGATGQYLVVGYEPKTVSMENPQQSFVVIYQQNATGFQEVYRYLPATTADYPMPFMFVDMWPITTWNNGQQQTTSLVTSWSETGADYWGSCPIVLAYKNGAFQAVPLYQGTLATDPRIKGSQWTSPDFQMTNAFVPANSVTTILAQSVDVQQGQVVLSFYGDNECKACEHTMVNITLDVPQ